MKENRTNSVQYNKVMLSTSYCTSLHHSDFGWRRFLNRNASAREISLFYIALHSKAWMFLLFPCSNYTIRSTAREITACTGL